MVIFQRNLFLYIPYINFNMAEIKYLSKSGLETLAEILATKRWVEGKN